MSGFLPVPREELTPDDELWGESRRFSRFEAWLDLRSMVAWKPRAVHYRGQQILVPVGACIVSVRTLCDRWGWSDKTVMAFLKRLVASGRISEPTPTLAGSLISLSASYLPQATDEGAPTATPTLAPTPTPTATPTRMKTEKTEKTEKTKDKSEKPALRAVSRARGVPAVPEEVAAAFEEAWSIYPRRIGGNSRANAADEFARRCRAGVEPRDLLAGTRRYAAFCATDPDRSRGEFVMKAETFYGRGEHYEEPWEIPADRGPRQNGRPSLGQQAYANAVAALADL